MEPEEQVRLQPLAAEAAVARREDRLEDAHRGLAQVVEICRRDGDELLLARALPALGQIERDLGNTGTAVALYGEAASLHRSLGPLRLLPFES